MFLLRPQEGYGWTPELLLNSVLHAIHHLLSYISTSPSMRIAITSIAALADAVAVSVIAQSVVATPNSTFASSARTSAHLANSDAAPSMKTTNTSPNGPLLAPFRSLR